MYPLRWVREVQARSDAKRRWRVLLDAAAFLPAHPLNLTETPADFVVASFYKVSWGLLQLSPRPAVGAGSPSA